MKEIKIFINFVKRQDANDEEQYEPTKKFTAPNPEYKMWL